MNAWVPMWAEGMSTLAGLAVVQATWQGAVLATLAALGRRAAPLPPRVRYGALYALYVSLPVWAGATAQVLSTAEVRAGWGALEVSGGVLLRRTEREIEAVVVPAPDDPAARPVEGDGWTLTLAEGWQLVETGVSGSWTVRAAGF